MSSIIRNSIILKVSVRSYLILFASKLVNPNFSNPYSVTVIVDVFIIFVTLFLYALQSQYIASIFHVSIVVSFVWFGFFNVLSLLSNVKSNS